MVAGMGEALVGNFPGRALSFAASTQQGGASARLAALPSKREALFVPGGLPTLIARSDSNGGCRGVGGWGAGWLVCAGSRWVGG